jgi:hypothetical protein
MDEDPFDRVAAAVADVGERVGEYTAIWREAVERNNAGNYKAEDYLVHLQALWGMSVRDAAKLGSAFVEAIAPLLPRDAPAGEEGEAKEGRTRSAESS